VVYVDVTGFDTAGFAREILLKSTRRGISSLLTGPKYELSFLPVS
jgi:hypothetical protein